jgi:hypothetical protein
VIDVARDSLSRAEIEATLFMARVGPARTHAQNTDG